MRVLSTHEAEYCAAFASDFVEHTAKIFPLDTVLTLHVGTPLNIFVVICETLAQPLPIRLFVLGGAGKHRLEN